MARSAKPSRSGVQIDPVSLYTQLGYLIADIPDFESDDASDDTQRWLAKAYALVLNVGEEGDAQRLKDMSSQLLDGMSLYQPSWKDAAAILHRALAVVELQVPNAVQGAFIPAGNAFDAMVALGRVLRTATLDVLIVDPYMDEKVLTDFGVLITPGVNIRLLADQAHYKASLKPAVSRWIAQYGSQMPIEARLSPGRTLHDRLIIVDNLYAWIATQSFNAFATRSPASVVRVDQDATKLKIDAYALIWHTAVPL